MSSLPPMVEFPPARGAAPEVPVEMPGPSGGKFFGGPEARRRVSRTAGGFTGYHVTSWGGLAGEI